MIFKILVAQFKFIGISEISDRPNFAPGTYNPTDPEFGLVYSGLIGSQEFSQIFLNRVKNVIDVSRKNDRRLLIREHTHSYFFNETLQVDLPQHPSWLVQELYSQFGEKFKCVVSVRDPIDSWLGLTANFPGEAFDSFDEYCRHYLEFVLTLERLKESSDVMLIRYEDLIADSTRELKRIAKFVGAEFSGETTAGWHKVSSSGNSGRQSNVLEKRPRRPFEISLLRESLESANYQKLIGILDYEHLAQSITTSEKIKARLLPMLRKVSSRIYKPLSKLKGKFGLTV